MLNGCKAPPGEQGSRTVRGRAALAMAEFSRQLPAPSWPSSLEAPYTHKPRKLTACRWVLSAIKGLVRLERRLPSSQRRFLTPAKHTAEPSLLFCPHHILLFPEPCQQFRKQRRKPRNRVDFTTWVMWPAGNLHE